MMSQAYSQIPNEDTLQANEGNTIPSWEYLRKEARTLEQQIDSRLISYSQSYSSGSASSSTILITQQELISLLSSLERVTNDMKAWTGKNSSHLHLHSRHVANLFEYNREFNKTRANIQQQRDHTELLSGSGGIYSRNHASHSNQYGRMENAHNDVDEILQRALDSQADLERQQTDLRSYQSRLKRVLVRFPLVRNVLNQIQQKKNRDTIVLGSLIGFCSFVLLWVIIF